MLQRGNSGDLRDLASSLCNYDLRKGDLFVLSWVRERRVRRRSIYLKLCSVCVIASCGEMCVYGTCLSLCLL